METPKDAKAENPTEARLRQILAYEFSGQRSYFACDIPTRLRIDALIPKLTRKTHICLKGCGICAEEKLLASDATSFLVVTNSDPRFSDGIPLGSLTKGVDGWRFLPRFQSRPSRKGWPTPRDALRGRVRNFRIVEAN